EEVGNGLRHHGRGARSNRLNAILPLFTTSSTSPTWRMSASRLRSTATKSASWPTRIEPVRFSTPSDSAEGFSNVARERCPGVFYACADGAEIRSFNRLLIDAGLIRNL